MNPWALPSFIAGIVSICMGAYVLYKNPKKSLNRLFSLLMLLSAVWTFGEFASRISSEPTQALIWIKILNTAMPFLGPGVLHFALVFTEQKKLSQSKLLLPILYGIGFMFLYFVWATDLFVKGIWRAYWGFMDVHGPMFPVQSMYLAICMFIAIILFFYAYLKAVELKDKKRKLYVLTGGLIPAIGGIVVNLMFPIFFGFEIVPLATLFFACGGVFFAYAILKYKLFIVEPATENAVEITQKYSLGKGHSYIIKEEKLDKAYEIFLDQVTHGIPGLCMSKLEPGRVKERYGLTKVPIIWVSFKEVEGAVSPRSLDEAKQIVSEIARKHRTGVILMDCFDMLKIVNGFEQAMRFLKEIKGMVAASEWSMLVAVDPKAFTAEQLTALERELVEVVA